jgi:hypothetical protein
MSPIKSRWLYPALIVTPVLVLAALSVYSTPVWLIFEQVWNVQIAKFAGCSAFFDTAQAWDARDGRYRPVFNTLICWEAQTSPFVVQIVRVGQVIFLVIAGSYLAGAFRSASSQTSLTLGLLIVLTFTSIPGLWQSVSNTWYSEISALTFLVLGLLTRNPLIMLGTGVLATFAKESFGVWLVALTLMYIWQRKWLRAAIGVAVTAITGWPMLQALTQPSYPSNQLNLTEPDLFPRVIDNLAGLSQSLALGAFGLLVVLLLFRLTPGHNQLAVAITGSALVLAGISLIHGTFRYQYVLDVTDLHALSAVYLLVLGVLMWVAPRGEFRLGQSVSFAVSLGAIAALFATSAWEARGAHVQSRNWAEATNALLDWVDGANFTEQPRVALPSQVPPNSMDAMLALDGRFENRITPVWIWRDDPTWADAQYYVRLTPADMPPEGYELFLPGGETGGVYRRN